MWFLFTFQNLIQCFTINKISLLRFNTIPHMSKEWTLMNSSCDSNPRWPNQVWTIATHKLLSTTYYKLICGLKSQSHVVFYKYGHKLNCISCHVTRYHSLSLRLPFLCKVTKFSNVELAGPIEQKSEDGRWRPIDNCAPY